MERNVGGMDRTARLVVGPLLVIVGLAMVVGLVPLSGGAAITVGLPVLLLIVGGVLVGTGGVQKCPINEAAGVNTYERQD